MRELLRLKKNMRKDVFCLPPTIFSTVLFFISFLVICGSFQEVSSTSTFEKDIFLSESQRDSLQKFTDVMENRVPHDYMKTQLYLLKWLRSKNFNIAKAEEAVAKHLKWRQLNKMDTIQTEDWSDMESQFRYSIESKDKQGQPTIYYDVGGTDLRKAVLAGQGDRIVRYAMKVFDMTCGKVLKMAEDGKNITRGILILNAKGFNPIQHGCVRCIPYLLRIVVGHLSEYPECADKIIVTNIPSIAEPLLAIAKPLLESHDLRIYGPNPKQILEALLKLYDIEEIPVQLGGRKVYRNSISRDDDDEEEEDYESLNIFKQPS